MSRLRPAVAALAPLVILFAFVCVMHVLAPSDPPGWRPANQVLFTGFIKGLQLSMLAVGVALVYRTNRIINFAQADLGTAPGVFVVSLMVAHGWHYWFALPLGIVGSTLLGVLVEFLFVRRFARSPRLILTVATIGIGQLLVALSLFIPRWLNFKRGLASNIKPPFDITFSVDSTPYDGNDLMVLVTVPLLLIGLGLFLRFSLIGIALRGSAESADRAALLGVPVRRIQTVVWSIASVLSFVTYFLNVGVVGYKPGSVAIELFLTALGAVVIGRLDRIPTIVSAAIGFGLIDAAVKSDWNDDQYRSAAIAFVIIAAVLFVRERRGSRIAAGSMSTWQSVEEVRGVPRELRHVAPVRLARIAIAALLVAFALIAPLIWSGESRISLLTIIVVNSIIGVSMVVLSGWAGHISLGHMAIVGIAGVVGASVTTLNDQDLVIGLVAGGAAGAVVLVAIGLPALRAKGISLGISTLALSFATGSYLLNRNVAPSFIADRIPTFRGYYFEHRPDLLWSINVDGDRAYYYLTVVCLGLAIAAARGIRRTRTGRAIVSMRENERAGQGYGVPARTTFVTALAASGFIAGVAGSLFIHQQQALDLSSFEPADGLVLFTIVVVGGLGSVGGAIAGSIYVWGTQYFLPNEWWFLAQGFGLLLVLMFFPGGLGAVMARIRDACLRWYANRHGIRVPSLIADTRVDDFVASTGMAEAVAEATELSDAQIDAIVAAVSHRTDLDADEVRVLGTPPLEAQS